MFFIFIFINRSPAFPPFLPSFPCPINLIFSLFLIPAGIFTSIFFVPPSTVLNFISFAAPKNASVSVAVIYASLFSRLARIALRNCSEFTGVGSTPSMMLTRSFVTIPALRVSKHASSSLLPNSTSSGNPSISPGLRRAPLQAKIVAIGLVDVSSPLRYL